MHRLPVFQTAGRAYLFLVREIGTILRLSWFPLLVVAIIQYFAFRAHVAALRSALAAGNTGALTQFAPMWQWQIMNVVVAILGTSIVAVALHRVILLGDRKPGRYLYVAFGKVEMLFALLPIAFLVPVAIAWGSIFGLSAGSVPRSALGVLIPLYLLAWAALIFVAIRLELILPITALERRYNFREAWALTRRNFWRIVGLWLVVFIPFMIVIVVVASATSPFAALGGAMAKGGTGVLDAMESRLLMQSIIGYVWSIIAGALGVAVLSYTYKALNGLDPDAVWTPDR